MEFRTDGRHRLFGGRITGVANSGTWVFEVSDVIPNVNTWLEIEKLVVIICSAGQSL